MRYIFGFVFAFIVSFFYADVAYTQSGTQFNIETVLANYKADRGDDYSLSQLGYGLMGDSHDIDTGSLSFRQLDVSIPGNSSIPVEFARRASGSSSHGSWEYLSKPNWSYLGTLTFLIQLRGLMQVRRIFAGMELFQII